MKQQVLEKTIRCCLINNDWSSNDSLGEAGRQVRGWQNEAMGDSEGLGKLEVRWRCPKTGWIRRGLNEIFQIGWW